MNTVRALLYIGMKAIFFNALADRATMSGMMVHRNLPHAGQGGSRSLARVPWFAPESSEEDSEPSSSESSDDLGYQLPNRPGTSGRTIALRAWTPIQTMWSRESQLRGDLFSFCCLAIDYVTLTVVGWYRMMCPCIGKKSYTRERLLIDWM